MTNIIRHPNHLVNESPWPFWTALSTMVVALRLLKFLHMNRKWELLLRMLILSWVVFKWWKDITCERTYIGIHTKLVREGLRWGIALFITSEVFFFLGFFWSFFHNSLAPDVCVGVFWPPTGIKPLNPLRLPLLNTAILLGSGGTVTWAHWNIKSKNLKKTRFSLLITVILGIYFTILQFVEYEETSFTLAEGIFGSTFFLTTGFHGFHVIVGTIFLLVCLVRTLNFNFRPSRHFGFEAAIWYWHFVDVVWLFLYASIYWWGGWIPIK